MQRTGDSYPFGNFKDNFDVIVKHFVMLKTTRININFVITQSKKLKNTRKLSYESY